MHIERSALFAHPRHKLYQLVNDVAAYPEYMDGCVGAEVLEVSDTHMLARLDLEKGGVRQSFITRNTLDAPYSIEMTLEEGPFSSFEGRWSFAELSDDACKVELRLEFEISNRVAAKAIGKLFAGIGDKLVEAICKRADTL